MSDPFNTPEWRRYAKRVQADLVPKIYTSAVTISLVPTGETDVKFAVELGLSIMMNKPIIAVVTPGSYVPDKLRQVADFIIEGDPEDPAFKVQVIDAIKMLTGSERN